MARLSQQRAVITVRLYRNGAILLLSKGGNSQVIGLKSDGTVVITPGIDKWGNPIDVASWSNIVAIAGGDHHIVGLKSDGTVVAVGQNPNGECDITAWKNIIAIAAGNSHTVELKSDGTVVATGTDANGQCDVSDWDLLESAESDVATQSSNLIIGKYSINLTGIWSQTATTLSKSFWADFDNDNVGDAYISLYSDAISSEKYKDMIDYLSSSEAFDGIGSEWIKTSSEKNGLNAIEFSGEWNLSNATSDEYREDILAAIQNGSGRVKQYLTHYWVDNNMLEIAFYVYNDKFSERAISEYKSIVDSVKYATTDNTDKLTPQSENSARKGLGEVTFRKGNMLSDPIIIQNTDIKQAVATLGSEYEIAVAVYLNEIGQQKMFDATTELAKSNGVVSIWFNDVCYSAPTVTSPLSGDIFVISGDFTKDSATALADGINKAIGSETDANPSLYFNFGASSSSNDEQSVQSTLRESQLPSITVKVNIPVKWTITVPEGVLNGSNSRIVIPSFDISDYELKIGDNVIEFTPTQTGVFAYSDWVGMLKGTITVVE
ncbi:MAG: hypothetical protein LBU36_08695 [Clostridiales bacterium]|jgi:hypothetical protein|nr:hypothetical protein [Clostridiales bacterium]